MVAKVARLLITTAAGLLGVEAAAEQQILRMLGVVIVAGQCHQATPRIAAWHRPGAAHLLVTTPRLLGATPPPLPETSHLPGAHRQLGVAVRLRRHGVEAVRKLALTSRHAARHHQHGEVLIQNRRTIVTAMVYGHNKAAMEGWLNRCSRKAEVATGTLQSADLQPHPQHHLEGLYESTTKAVKQSMVLHQRSMSARLHEADGR
mmetsp:Transcript_42047/g.94543  ORF Transcript_42047/g.94543 Transcript_42047/m.94543 type:complete len:204 (-) Transcript_42047:334-945(-)